MYLVFFYQIFWGIYSYIFLERLNLAENPSSFSFFLYGNFAQQALFTIEAMMVFILSCKLAMRYAGGGGGGGKH